MRRHHTSHFSRTNNYHLSSIKSDSNRNTISTRQYITSSGTHSFAHTDFNNCQATGSNYGGAIYCISGALRIEDCTFKNCQSSDRSGAIFFSSPNLCNDTNNFFVNSSAEGYTGVFDEFRATTSFHSSSTYMNSIAKGYFGILNVEDTPDATLSSCIFINGSAIGGCGLLSLTKIKGIAKVSNCIFAKGSANDYGGAFGTFGDYTNNPHPYFYFCYFSNNVCSNKNRGADFDANGTTGSLFSKEQIIHCFSSSRGVRIYIEGKSNSDVDNWLPQGRLVFPVDDCRDYRAAPIPTK